MNFSPQKFPDFFYQEKKLLWDSRQGAGPQGVMAFVPTDFPVGADLERDLLAKTAGEALRLSRWDWGQLLSQLAGFPSSQLRVWGVTGTNGKSTTCALLRGLLLSLGENVVELGTLGFAFWKPEQLDRAFWQVDTGFTTPEAPTLHDLFRQCVEQQVVNVVMEVSSHASTLGRVAGVDFDGLIFTNLSQDHLDFHKSMEGYAAAKTELFTRYLAAKISAKKKVAVINDVDPVGQRIVAQLPLDVKFVSSALGTFAELIESTSDGLRMKTPWGEINSPLVGEFNAENLAGALALLCTHPKFDFKKVATFLSHFGGPRGRLERVVDPVNSRNVFVDYAHSPDALDKVLKTLRQILTPGKKLSVVFGCGGDRDKGKRPLMGAIAAGTADEILITSDNPRTENPQHIVDEIALGVPKSLSSKVHLVVERDAAIAMAVKKMAPQDILLIAGKGHEEYQIIGTQKKDFSDQACAAKALSTK